MDFQFLVDAFDLFIFVLHKPCDTSENLLKIIFSELLEKSFTERISLVVIDNVTVLFFFILRVSLRKAPGFIYIEILFRNYKIENLSCRRFMQKYLLSFFFKE